MARPKLSRDKNNERMHLFPEENDHINNAVYSVNQNFNCIMERLDEAETFMLASKEYVKMSRKMIANLRNCTAILEVDLKTAEEAILESKRKISALKSEMETNFSFFHKFHESHEVGSHRVKGSSKRQREKKNFNMYYSEDCLPTVNDEISLPTKLDENERNSENDGVKSNVNSEVSDFHSMPSWMNRLQKFYSDADFEDDCCENLTEEDCTKSYRGNSIRKSLTKHSFKTDSTTSRKKSSSDIFSYKVVCGSGSESDYFCNRKKYYSELLEEKLKQKYNGICASEVDDLSLKKVHRNCNMRNSKGLRFVNTEDTVSSENDEYYSVNELYSSPYQTENMCKENYKNIKAKMGLHNSFKPVQDREKEILSNECSENHLNEEDIYLSQEEKSSQYYKNSLKAIARLREILHTEKSKDNFKQFDNFCGESEDKSVTSNYSYLNSIQNPCTGYQYSSEDADSDKSASCGKWSGEALNIFNSTQPYITENSVESQSNVCSAIRREESYYVSMDSSACSNESTYFSFVRGDRIKERSYITYASTNSLDPPSKDTTDTSVYDFSSGNQQSDSLHSRLNCEILDETNISDMSLTEISSNASVHENSNSFQFHSDSSLEDNSRLETYSSNFSASKNSPSFLQTDISYESFREGVLSASLNTCSNEETSSECPNESSSQEVNSSHVLENGLPATETSMAAKNDSSCIVVTEAGEISGMSERDSLQTNLKKSKSWEMFSQGITRGPCELPNNLPLVKSENSKRYVTENEMYSFKKVDVFDKMKPVNAKIYSKKIRSFIQDNHWTRL